MAATCGRLPPRPQEPNPEGVFQGGGRVGGEPGRKPPAADEKPPQR